MKHFKKPLLLTLSAIGSFALIASTTSCKKNQNRMDTIYVSIINKGYGTEWIDHMMKKFIASNEQYSSYSYELINNYDDETTKTTVESGEKYCNYDLVFHGGGSNLIDTNCLLDLAPVYNMSYGGSTLADNMDSSIVSNFNRNGKYYAIPWTTGGSGILINYDLVKSKLGNNWESTYPCRTTNEFMEFVNALKGQSVTPFVVVTNRDFYSPLYEAWWAQYEGMEGVENYYSAKYEDANGDMQEGPEAFVQEGILQSLKVTESIFKTESNYLLYSEWNKMQAAYMEGKSAMIVNGPWMWHEMTGKLSYNAIDMRYIKTPILSALGAKLNISTFTTTTGVNSSDINYQITDETKLLQAIDYVDGKTATKPADVSDAVLEKIAEARRLVVSQVDYSDACIPSYSPKANVALDFLKWMYSEQGQREYVTAADGLFLPVKNNIDVQLNNFAASHKKLIENATFVFGNMQWKFSKTNLIPVTARIKAPVEYLFTGKSGVKIDGNPLDNAFEIYQYNKKYYETGSNWELLVNAAK